MSRPWSTPRSDAEPAGAATNAKTRTDRNSGRSSFRSGRVKASCETARPHRPCRQVTGRDPGTEHRAHKRSRARTHDHVRGARVPAHVLFQGRERAGKIRAASDSTCSQHQTDPHGGALPAPPRANRQTGHDSSRGRAALSPLESDRCDGRWIRFTARRVARSARWMRCTRTPWRLGMASRLRLRWGGAAARIGYRLREDGGAGRRRSSRVQSWGRRTRSSETRKACSSASRCSVLEHAANPRLPSTSTRSGS